MTEQKKLSIHPEYDEKKGVFLGYVVKRGNSFLKDNDGNKILLSVQEANNEYFVSYQPPINMILDVDVGTVCSSVQNIIDIKFNDKETLQ